MDGVERRKSLKELLGLNGIGCCGAHWGLGPSTVLDGEESPLEVPIDEEQSPLRWPINEEQNPSRGPISEEQSPLRGPMSEEQSPLRGPMNLAEALAAERQYLAGQNSDEESPMGQHLNRPNSGPIGTAMGLPLKTSLMRLLQETDGEDLEREGREREAGAGGRSDMVCCVCMGRKKGAAFIPCGHTFCRVCSRELWMNRGSCPLCNRPIIEILDIF